MAPADAPKLTREQKLKEVIKLVPGPDFPTGGLIVGRRGIQEAYVTGRGGIQVRARAEVETTKKGDRTQIVVTEIPYQVNKKNLLERMADLVREKTLEGISDIRDESDRDGLRVVIELKRGEVGEVVLNNLYKHTQLQQTFGIILLAIVGGRPRVLNLLEIIEHFIEFRREVVRRRTEFELRKAEARAHILEGLRIALDHLDAVITLIRGSRNPAEAKVGLITQFGLSEIQSQAILDMQLQRLTGLERQKILDELAELGRLIERLREILANQQQLLQIVVDELKAVQARFDEPRRTEIIDQDGEFSIEDLIADEDVAVTVTDTGYIKRTPITTYRRQRRGGKGRIGMRTREEDVVNHLFVASTHSYLMVFSDRGRAYWLKVHEIPDVGADGRGKSIANLVQMEAGEKIADMLAVRDFDETHFVVMGTRNGTIKKTELSAFSNPRAGGIIAMGVEEQDAVMAIQLSDGSSEIFIGTREGKAIRFPEDEVRPMGRTAYGVRGIQLREGDEVVAMQVAKPGGRLLTVTERGYAKQTELGEYRVTGRGGLGVKNVEITDRNGPVVNIAQVHDDDELLVITEQGKILRTPGNDIRTAGRATQGVRLMDLEAGDRVVSIALVLKTEDEIGEDAVGEPVDGGPEPSGGEPGPEEPSA
jgi:DNA gyrase subunit A